MVTCLDGYDAAFWEWDVQLALACASLAAALGEPAIDPPYNHLPRVRAVSKLERLKSVDAFFSSPFGAGA